jgi:hypothetical protein
MLTQRTVDRVTKPGRCRDRNGIPGLLLQVSASRAKSWLLRYVLGGTERWAKTRRLYLHGTGCFFIRSIGSSRACAKRACRKNERSVLSSGQLVKQRLRLFQIERVEAFGELGVDWSEDCGP